MHNNFLYCNVAIIMSFVMRIFFIDNNVICEQKQFYFFFPTVYTFSTGCTAQARISSMILKRSDVGGILLYLTLVRKPCLSYQL